MAEGKIIAISISEKKGQKKQLLMYSLRFQEEAEISTNMILT